VSLCRTNYSHSGISTDLITGKYSGGLFAIIAMQLNNINMKTLGVLLIVVGLVMSIFTGFNIITRKTVVDLGAVEINSSEKTPIYWSPITGGVLAVAGVLVLMASKKNYSS
jgi:hypothetical protein